MDRSECLYSLKTLKIQSISIRVKTSCFHKKNLYHNVQRVYYVDNLRHNFDEIQARKLNFSTSYVLMYINRFSKVSKKDNKKCIIMHFRILSFTKIYTVSGVNILTYICKCSFIISSNHKNISCR